MTLFIGNKSFWKTDLRIIDKNAYTDCLDDFFSVLKLIQHELQRNYSHFCSYDTLRFWSTITPFFPRISLITPKVKRKQSILVAVTESPSFKRIIYD